jgi:hypothetical protein
LIICFVDIGGMLTRIFLITMVDIDMRIKDQVTRTPRKNLDWNKTGAA